MLHRDDVPYALCGGMAVVLHGYPRLTRDIDLLIRKPDLAAAETALAKAGFTIPGGTIPFGRGGPHERELVRFLKRVDDDLLTVDLLLLPEFLGTCGSLAKPMNSMARRLRQSPRMA